MEQPKEKRTWLAVALAIPVVGLGHVYLRRWARAIGWLFLVVGSSTFVPLEELDKVAAIQEAFLSGGDIAALPTPDYIALAPVLIVVTLSILDAYVIARRTNAEARAQAAALAATGDTDQRIACPACGRDVDPELDFCHWCTTKLQWPEDTETVDSRT